MQILYAEDKDFKTDGPNWLKLSIIKCDANKDILSEYVKIRHTNRNSYSTQFTELEKMILNSSLKASIQSTVLGFKISNINPGLLNYFQKCEEIFWNQKQIVSDLSKMISTNLIKNPKVGFFWKTLGINYFEILLIKFLSKLPFITENLSFVFNFINKMKLKKLLKNSGGILFFTTPNSVKLNYMEVGRSIFRSWLQLTALDIECQPLSIGTFLPYYLNIYNNSKGIDANWIQEVISMNTKLKESLNISENQNI